MAVPVVNLLPFAIAAALIAVASSGVLSSDDETLLAFKVGLADRSSGVLASWNGSNGFCRWEGVACSRGRVVSLILPFNGLAGTLSPVISNLTFLQTLNLSFNWFQGEVPASIGHLARLQTLDLSYNEFSGTLPVNLSFCTSLLFLRLGSNRLHGGIPVELGDRLTSLEMLSLGNNSLTGTIPGSLASLI
jgi:hypothetical protein